MEPGSGLEEISQERQTALRQKHARLRGSLESILATSPSDPALLADLGESLIEHFDFAGATRVFDHLGALPLVDTSPLLQAAKSLNGARRSDHAIRFLTQALSRHPEDAALNAELAAAYELSGQPEVARELAARALLYEPTSAPAIALLARHELKSGNGHAARVRLVQRLQQAPTGEEWILHHELAAVFDHLDEPQAAIREIGKAKTGASGHARIALAQSRETRSRQWDLTSRINAAAWSRWSAPALPVQAITFVGGFPCSGVSNLASFLYSHSQCRIMSESGIASSQFSGPLHHQDDLAGGAFAVLDQIDDESLTRSRDRYLHCAEAVIGPSLRGKMLLDFDTSYPADLPLLLRTFPGAKVITVIRDPREAVLEYYLTHQPTTAKEAPSFDLREACRFYAETMWHWLHLAPALPHATLQVRYEDLLKQPASTLQKVTELLEIDRVAVAQDEQGFNGARSGRWQAYEPWLAPHLHHLEPFLDTFGYR